MSSDDQPTEGLGRYAELASEVTRATLGVTERALAQFVRQGEVAAEHAERVVEEIVTRSVESSGALARLVRDEVERAVERVGFVRADELDALRREVADLRTAVHSDDAPADDGGVAP